MIIVRRMGPQKLVGKVILKQNLVGPNWLVRLELQKKTHFVPGQYVSLKVTEEGMRRSYSVASLPGERTIDLLVDISPMGVGSKYVLGLSLGDEVEMLAFLGRFVINPTMLTKFENVLFLATGTGVAPFKPMVEDLLYRKHYKGRVSLVWGMRYEKDLYWLKELDSISRDFDNFKTDVVVSKPSEQWRGYKGHVDVVVDQMSPDWAKTLVYLCGSPNMISEMTVKLTGKGVPEENIFYEKYF